MSEAKPVTFLQLRDPLQNERATSGYAFQNRAFRYGDGLFETMLSNRSGILNFREHLHRLCAGLKTLKIQLEQDALLERLVPLLRQVLAQPGNWHYCRLRLQVVRNGQGAYLPQQHDGLLFLDAHFLDQSPRFTEAPEKLCLFREIPLTYSPLSGVKSCNALPYILAARHAEQEGFHDALLFCGEHISESSRANLFIRKNGFLLTPPLKDACLPGIMRQEILQAAAQLKIQALEQSLKKEDLLNAEEVFLTNSIRGMIPVSQIEEKILPLPSGIFFQRLSSCIQRNESWQPIYSH